MTPAPRIWIYAPTPGTVEVLLLGPPEVIARPAAIAIGGMAGSPDLLNVHTIGLGVHALLITAQIAPTAQFDAVGTALDALRYVLPAGIVEWREPREQIVGIL